MPFRNEGWTKTRSELLMDISATLSDLTRKLETCDKVPGYLSQVLGVEPMTLAIISESSGKPEVLKNACSRADCTCACAEDLLAIYQQTRPLSVDAGPTLRPMIEIERPSNQAGVGSTSMETKFPRATVFSYPLVEGHRMLLIVHQPAECQHLPEGIAEVLQAVAQHLAKLLACLVAWTAQPDVLGAPFNKLTDREWNVLRSLDTEAGEKQLADQLGLSPHTLHSHIKSIYRKVGVQGRLPLLLRVESSLQNLRTERLNTRPTSRVQNVNSDHAVAAG